MHMNEFIETKLKAEAQTLPAAAIADEVNASLAQHPNLVLTAPPGAGKSTLLPLTIMSAMPKGKILMLEPRRLAARQIAERMASLLGEEVGQTVGYRVRFEHRTSAQTRIEVLTEGILSRRLVADPTLDGVAAVIFDEFHERSIFADVALALTRESQQVVRPDLRIVIMSATIDSATLCDELHAPLIQSEGRMFPVTIHRHETEATAEDCAEVVAHAVRIAHDENEGDILAFLPGEGEIRKTAQLLADKLGGTRVMPLYGMLPQAEQRRAIAPSRPGERKVVLATPIAETSLTIEGVRVVVDSGLCRQMVFDPQSGLSHLETVRISLDMADQRTGRAGRVAPGVCYRLWTLGTEHRMAPCRTPEIATADLAPMVLDVAAWGEANPARLPWLTTPPSGHIGMAQSLLKMLGAIDDSNAITKHGQELAVLPCHPRIAQMILSAHDDNGRALAADIAAIVEEKDPLAATEQSADITLRLEALQRHRSNSRKALGGGSRAWERIAQIAEQYQRMAHVDGKNTQADLSQSGALLAAAYPERIASVRDAHKGLFLLSSGDMAALPKGDDLAHEDWIVAANLNAREGMGRIFLAAPLEPQDLQPLLREKRVVAWDIKKGGMVAQTEYRIGCLALGTRPLKDIGRDEIEQAVCSAARRDGARMLDFGADDVVALQSRVAALNAWHPELNLPDISTEAVLSNVGDWLPMYLGKNVALSDLRKIDMAAVLWGMLSYDQQKTVDSLAPSHIAVPTGSRLHLEYRLPSEPPVLRVRLQEMFGVADTPKVDGGCRGVLLELLSPGFKPVQLTQDLKNFWAETYFEVRKELKRRYPKHYWPDDPASAEAVRGVKRQKE